MIEPGMRPYLSVDVETAAAEALVAQGRAEAGMGNGVVVTWWLWPEDFDRVRKRMDPRAAAAWERQTRTCGGCGD